MLLPLFGTQARSADAPPPAKSSTPKSVLLSEAGIAKAIIVLPDALREFKGNDEGTQRMTEQAGSIVAEFLRRMTGSEFKTVRVGELGEVEVTGDNITSAKFPGASYILIGETDLTRRLKITPDLQPGAMYVKSTGNVVALLGTYDGTAFTGGAVYSAHHFLESLGVRYLWPGELGLVVPSRKDISIPYGTDTHTPIIKQRNMRQTGGGPRTTEGAKNLGVTGEYGQRMSDASQIKVPYILRSPGGWLEWQNLGGDIGIRGGHSLGLMYDLYGKEHPGWFALQPNGSREQHSSERARLCVSNSEVVQQVANDLIAQADANPNVMSIALSPNDLGADTFCMCKVNALGEPGCVSYDPPEGRKINSLYKWDIPYVSLTDRYAVFYNRVADIVAKKYPKVLLVADAYSVYSAPPVKTTLRPNLVVRYVPSTMDDWDAWSAKASKIYWRPNTLSGPWRFGELKFNKSYTSDLNYAAHHSTIATDFDSIINNWATEGLNYYVLAQMNWNPDASAEKLMDEYCRAGFGPAAPEIRSYFAKVEKVTAVRDPDMMARYEADPPKALIHVRADTLAEYYTPQFLGDLRGLLDAAAKKVSGNGNEDNEKIRQRIAFLRVGFDWTDIQTRAYRVAVALKKGEPVDLNAAAKLLAERRAMMRKIYYENPLAVNVTYVNYADRGYWQQLQKAIADAGITMPADVEPEGKTMIDADENGQAIIVPKTN